jgi:DNA/RNA endonuclease YhcR with UshA esterase domain
MRRVAVLLGVLSFITLSNSQTFVPIHEIQSNMLPGSDTSAYFGQTVTTTGIVTSSVGQVAGSRVFYLEEETGGPWSGIQCYFTPGNVVQVEEGDTITVTGLVSEYYGNTEIVISNPADVIIHDSLHPLPPVAHIPCGYLDTTATSLYDPDSAEAYEGVLVQVDNVYVTGLSGPQGDWEVTDGTGYVYIRDNGNYSYVPQLGDNLNIRGPVRVYYGLYRIEPRYDEDIMAMVLHLSMAFSISRDTVLVIFTTAVDPVTGQIASNYTITGGVSVLSAILDPTDQKRVYLHTSLQSDETLYTLYVSGVLDTLGNPIPENDSTTFWGGFTRIYTIQSDTVDSGRSAWEGRRVTVTAICTVDSTSSSWYYIEDSQGGPFSGIQIYDYTYEPLMGDSVILVGTVDEYYLMTEILDVVYFKVVSSGNPLPPPVDITTGDLSSGTSTGEQYEGVLVRTDTAIVVNSNPGGPYWEIDDGTGICQVANRDAYTYEPQDGDTVVVTGVVRFAYGNYQIEPRGDYDIILPGAVEESEITGDLPLITTPKPVPSKNSVLFSISLEKRDKVEIKLFNVTGRCVRKIYSGELSMGTHSFKIGKGSLPSGVYMLRIEAKRFRRSYPVVFTR